MDKDRGGSLAHGVREWVQFCILLFATAWGVYTFVFQETIVPARRPATLTVKSQLEEIGRSERSVLVRARIHAINNTEKKVYVPALWYTVRGMRLSSQPGTLPEYRSQVEQAPHLQINARYSAVTFCDVVAVGTILSQLTDYYEPKDETTNEVFFEVPLDRYDALEMRAEFFVAKDTTGLASPEWNVTDAGEIQPQLVLNDKPYDPGNDAAHYDWALRSGAGFNWAISTLSFWDGQPSEPPPGDESASQEPYVQAAEEVPLQR